MARPARPVDPGNERELLLAAATAFARDGYRAASMNEILQTAGWAKSSLYHYFDGKRGLHDHVVTALREELGSGLAVPELDTLTATDFWPAMTRLVGSLADTADRHPEVRHLGLMYHRDDTAEPDGALQALRDDVAAWLNTALRHGLDLGLVRQDIPADLAVELTVTVLGVLDRWAMDRAAEAPGGQQAGRLSLRLVQDLIGKQGHQA